MENRNYVIPKLVKGENGYYIKKQIAQSPVPLKIHGKTKKELDKIEKRMLDELGIKI